jgi:hypothetical protein
MMVLKGAKKVDTQLKSLGMFQAKVVAALEASAPAMEKQARKDVLEVVYRSPENPKFPRSGNMAASTDVVVESDADSASSNIMLNPAKATLPFDYTYGGDTKPSGLMSFYNLIGRAGKPFYPSYVLAGTFFRKTGAPRDYRAKWAETLPPKFKAIVGKAVRAFK